MTKPAPALSNAPEKKGLENPLVPAIEQSATVLAIEKVMQFPFTNKTQPRTRINKMGVHPITKETMVADLQGQLYILNAQNQPSVYFNAADQVKNFTNTPRTGNGPG